MGYGLALSEGEFADLIRTIEQHIHKIEELTGQIVDRVNRALPWLGPLVGFFGSGYFSLFGAMLAELYPTSVRGAGQGFTYNFGRLLCAAAPYFVGLLADSKGIGTALALNSAFFALAGLLIWSLPETRQTDLEKV